MQVTGVSALNRCHPCLIISLIKSAPLASRVSLCLCGNNRCAWHQHRALRMY
ncbi:hypothetical protein SynSYN20_00445 [Synechococcus sp. SYN20]|nr:hypothetical protein SynSYN20_00445 [Synechococcus sp. SYN20]